MELLRSLEEVKQYLFHIDQSNRGKSRLAFIGLFCYSDILPIIVSNVTRKPYFFLSIPTIVLYLSMESPLHRPQMSLTHVIQSPTSFLLVLVDLFALL